MKKFLMAVALLACSTPAWAISMSDWAANPIVSGDKTFTLNSSNNLGGPPVDIVVVDNGSLHSLQISNLQNTPNFTVNFTVSVSSGPNIIIVSRVAQADVLGNTTAGSTTLTTGGYSDVINGTGTGANNVQSTTSVTFDTTSFGITGGLNSLASLNYEVLQQAPPVIPEPSTFALAGLAVVGLVIARRRAR